MALDSTRADGPIRVEVPKSSGDHEPPQAGARDGHRPVSLAESLEAKGLRVVTSKRLLVYAGERALDFAYVCEQVEAWVVSNRESCPHSLTVIDQDGVWHLVPDVR